MNYIYFGISRAIKSHNYDKIYAGSSGTDRIYVFYDNDLATPSEYLATIRFKRYDEIVVGDLDMIPSTAINPANNTLMRCFYLDLDAEILKCPGSLQISVAYNKSIDGVLISEACASDATTIYYSVPINLRENAQIQSLSRAVQRLAAQLNEQAPAVQEVVVKFVWGDGTIDTNNIDIMTAVSQPAPKTRVGLTLVGWYIDSGFINAHLFETIVTEDLILYAKWINTSSQEIETPGTTEGVHRVDFITNGGTEVASRLITHGTVLTTVNTEKVGYTLEKWYLDANFTNPFNLYSTPVNSDIILYAKWIYTGAYKIKYIVDGTTYAVKNVSLGESIASADMPPVPTKDGYIHVGWYSSLDVSGTRIDLTALEISDQTTVVVYSKFVKAMYKVYIYEEGNTTGIPIITISNIAHRTRFSELVIAYPEPGIGYEFDAYYSKYKDIRYTADYEIVSDIHLYPYFKTIAQTTTTKTITFNSNGGGEVESQTVNYGELVTEPSDPTKADSTFLGWYKDIALTIPYDFESPVGSSNFTLYAKWTASTLDTYSVNFIANGSIIKTVTKTVGQSLVASDLPTNPTKVGATFSWWYYNNNHSKRFEYTDNITVTTNLVARWLGTIESTEYVRCPECDGIGTITGETDCPDCPQPLHSGGYTNPGYIECYNCLGYGAVDDVGPCWPEAEGASSCPVCGGNGYLPCPTCDEAGYITVENQPCTRCGGNTHGYTYTTVVQTTTSYTYTFDALT